MQIATINRRLRMRHGFICKLKHLIAEIDLVNWVLILSCKVLLDTRKERLGKEESTDPEAIGFAVCNPMFVHSNSLFQVLYVAK